MAMPMNPALGTGTSSMNLNPLGLSGLPSTQPQWQTALGLTPVGLGALGLTLPSSVTSGKATGKTPTPQAAPMTAAAPPPAAPPPAPTVDIGPADTTRSADVSSESGGGGGGEVEIGAG